MPQQTAEQVVHERGRAGQAPGQTAIYIVLLYLTAAGLLLIAGRSVGLANGEFPRLQTYEASAECLRRWLAPSRDPAGTCVLTELFPTSAQGAGWFVLVSGYLRASLGDHLGDSARLLALRLGPIALGASCAPLMFLLVRPSLGARAAVLAACSLLLCPPFLFLSVTSDPDALLLSPLLMTLLGSCEVLRGRSLRGNVCAILGFGLSLGMSLGGGLVLLLLVLLHAVTVRWRAARRMAAGARVPFPVIVLSLAVFGTCVFVLTSPWLWTDGGNKLRDLVLASLAPQVVPVLYRGSQVTADHLPRDFVVQWLALRVPFSLILLAILGGTSWSLRSLSRTHPKGARPPRDRAALGRLCCVGLILTVLLPAVLPEQLVRFPPRAALALPFVAMAAGCGIDIFVGAALRFLVRRANRFSFSTVQRELLGSALALLILAPALRLSLRSPATLCVAFSPVGGGVSRVAQRHTFSLADGSLLEQVTPAIDSLGKRTLAVFAPEIPGDVWEGLQRLGILQTALHPVASSTGADVWVVFAGGQAEGPTASLPPSARFARVERDRVTVLSLWLAHPLL